ncbi:reverse transcriptase domain-containing protein [Tanacetum coccineum]
MVTKTMMMAGCFINPIFIEAFGLTLIEGKEAVIVKSFEIIYRSNMVGCTIVTPLFLHIAAEANLGASDGSLNLCLSVLDLLMDTNKKAKFNQQPNTLPSQPEFSDVTEFGKECRKGYSAPWLRCVGPNQPHYVLLEAHFGSCGAHAGATTIAQKAARLGYYWPTMYLDATQVVDECHNCQEHAPITQQPQCNLTSISRPWPFYQWGIDLVGPFPKAQLKIKQKFTSVAHPQANGQTEVTNKILLQGLKTRLGKAKGQWVEELPNVLWAHRTTAKIGYHCTPFSLVYGSEAVLPPEIGVPTYHIQSYEENKNIVDLQLNLELLKERRELAYLCEAKYKRQIERYYNSKVRHAHLRVGDFVLRKNEASQQEGHKKLDPNWE